MDISCTKALPKRCESSLKRVLKRCFPNETSNQTRQCRMLPPSLRLCHPKIVPGLQLRLTESCSTILTHGLIHLAFRMRITPRSGSLVHGTKDQNSSASTTRHYIPGLGG